MNNLKVALLNEKDGLPLATFLAALPSGALHHKEHIQRHPGAIYAVSIQRVWNAMERTLVEHQLLVTKAREDINATVWLDAMKELIASIQAHLDDCFLILKCCWPIPPNAPNERFADRWLKAVGHPTVGTFRNKIDSYKNHIDLINNNLKHNHGRLRPVVMDTDDGRIVGYYVESALRNGGVGPNEELHPHNTVFSVNRDLRYHTAFIFGVGNELREALKGAIDNPGHCVSTVQPASQSFTALKEILDKVTCLPFLYFPDEARKPCVLPKYDSLKGELRIIFRSMSKPRFPRNWNASVTFSCDGYSTKYLLPYLGHDHAQYWFKGRKNKPQGQKS